MAIEVQRWDWHWLRMGQSPGVAEMVIYLGQEGSEQLSGQEDTGEDCTASEKKNLID